MGPVLPAHVGEVAGAQVAGEEDGGGEPLLQRLQLLLGEGLAAAGGGGQEKVLRHLLQSQGRPALAEALQRLLQPPLEGPARQGGGDHHPGELLIQLGGGLLQRGQAVFKVQNGPGEAPGLALPHDLLAQRAGGAQAVEVPVVDDHQPAFGSGAVRTEQVGARPEAVGQMGGGGLPAPEGGQLPGRQGNDKGVLWHGATPLSEISTCDILHGMKMDRRIEPCPYHPSPGEFIPR